MAIFKPFKKVLKSNGFKMQKDIKAVVVQWFQQHPTELQWR
jgi:hypothetical protein